MKNYLFLLNLSILSELLILKKRLYCKDQE